MNERALLSVSIKVLGLYLISQSIVYASGMLSGLLYTIFFDTFHRSFGEALLGAIWGLITPVALLATGGAFIWFGDAIAARISTADPEEVLSKPAESERLYAIAFTLAGVIILIWNVPDDLTRLIVSVVGLARQGALQDRTIVSTFWQSGITLVLRTILGLYLVFGARRLARFILSLRRAGISVDQA